MMPDEELRQQVEKTRQATGAEVVLDTSAEEADWLHRRSKPGHRREADSLPSFTDDTDN
ncbi:MAG: hypothetical protein H0T44_05090 [Gemmatimonadales bacterium]|nr:hypothetical protein [Gemmatimonadales bacterium]